MGLFQSRPPYLVVIGRKVKAVWTLHALILVDSPEVAVVRQLAQMLANFSGKVMPVKDVVLADFAVRHSHSPAGVLNWAGNGKRKQ